VWRPVPSPAGGTPATTQDLGKSIPIAQICPRPNGPFFCPYYLTHGLVLNTVVHSAGIMDRDGIPLLLEPMQGRFPRMQHVWLDAAYNGQGKSKHWVETTLGWTAGVVRHPMRRRSVIVFEDVEVDWGSLIPPPGFHVLPRRWLVERTLAGLIRIDG
jgi:putative transposase